MLTDMPMEYGGEGRSFSATDLLAAALGACIATNIDGVAVRHGIPLEGLEVRVEKSLSREPKRVDRLVVSIDLGMPVSSEVRQRIERAAEHCPVHRSLHPDVIVMVGVHAPEEEDH